MLRINAIAYLLHRVAISLVDKKSIYVLVDAGCCSTHGKDDR